MPNTTKPSFIDVLEHVADGVHVEIVPPNTHAPPAPSAADRKDPARPEEPAQPRAPAQDKD